MTIKVCHTVDEVVDNEYDREEMCVYGMSLVITCVYCIVLYRGFWMLLGLKTAWNCDETEVTDPRQELARAEAERGRGRGIAGLVDLTGKERFLTAVVEHLVKKTILWY
jgi:hypothetical protein